MTSMFRAFTRENKERDSSDEEGDERVTEDASLIHFPVYCVKSQRNKELLVDLYKSIIHQRSQKKVKVLRCKDIQKIVVDTDKNQVIIDVRRRDQITTKQKVFNFDKLGLAPVFKSLVDFSNAEGEHCRHIFDQIVKSRSKFISQSTLARALKGFELPADGVDIRKM
jgi:hypothetical protein